MRTILHLSDTVGQAAANPYVAVVLLGFVLLCAFALLEDLSEGGAE